MFATKVTNPPKSVDRASLIIHGTVKKNVVNVFIIVIKLGKKSERKPPFCGI